MSSVSHITRNITDLYTDATQIPRAFKNTTNLDFLDNNVSNISRDITNSLENLENAPVWLIIVNVLICTWIIIANAVVFLCLVTSRKAIKININIQLLSLSLTDMLVGTCTIPATLTPITNIFSKYETCACLIYMYFVSQCATLYHTLLICIHRLVTIKRTSNMNDSNNANLKIILVQIMAIWFGSLVFMSIPFLVFARFGETVVSCSFYTLLEDNFLVGLGIINITLLWPAHICINIIYVYLFVYLRKRLRTINTAQITSKYPPKENSQRSNRVHDNALPPLETPLDIQTKPPSKVQSVSSICGGPGCSTDHAQTKCRYINVKEVGNTTTNESPSNREKESDAKVPDTALIARARGQEGTKLRCTYDNRLGLQKQRRVLVTIGILLISLNVFMTPLDFVFLIEIFNFGQLTRGVRFVFAKQCPQSCHKYLEDKTFPGNSEGKSNESL